jgi:cyclophilin family peptidyl-prolyl cis-trans isomerase
MVADNCMPNEGHLETLAMQLIKLLSAAFLVGSLLVSPIVRAQNQPEKPAAPDKGAQPTPPPSPKAEAPMVYVLMKTSKGDITLELNQEKAPISTENFLRYVDKKFYDGTIFHRIMSDFMIQGGGMDTSGGQKAGTDKPIKNEWQNGLKNVKNSLAMARLGGGPNSADSATSQFYINVKDNPGLDRKQADNAAYAVFGRVVAGFDVVEKIKNVETVMDTRGEKSKPVEQVKIETVRRMTPDEVTALKAKLPK